MFTSKTGWLLHRIMWYIEALVAGIVGQLDVEVAPLRRRLDAKLPGTVFPATHQARLFPSLIQSCRQQSGPWPNREFEPFCKWTRACSDLVKMQCSLRLASRLSPPKQRRSTLRRSAPSTGAKFYITLREFHGWDGFLILPAPVRASRCFAGVRRWGAPTGQ